MTTVTLRLAGARAPVECLHYLTQALGGCERGVLTCRYFACLRSSTAEPSLDDQRQLPRAYLRHAHREDSELSVVLLEADWREGAARRHDQLGWDALLGRAHCADDRVDLYLRRVRTLEEDPLARSLAHLLPFTHTYSLRRVGLADLSINHFFTRSYRESQGRMPGRD